MSGNRTFTMIKPDAVEAGNIGNIIQMITDAGFSIKAMKLTNLSTEQAQEFYAVHAERPFYSELVSYMTSGAIVAAILEKDNAVADFRALIGATDPLISKNFLFKFIFPLAAMPNDSLERYTLSNVKLCFLTFIFALP